MAATTQADGSATKYCTHRCLLALVNRTDPDPLCANAAKHHTAPRPTLSELLQQVKTHIERRIGLGDDCKVITPPGSFSILIKISIPGSAYTFVAKMTGRMDRTAHEAAIYDRLKQLQGVNIPVCLGHVTLNRGLYQFASKSPSLLLLLSWAGECITAPTNSPYLISHRLAIRAIANASIDMVHKHNVLHNHDKPWEWLFSHSEMTMMLADFTLATAFFEGEGVQEMEDENIKVMIQFAIM